MSTSYSLLSTYDNPLFLQRIDAFCQNAVDIQNLMKWDFDIDTAVGEQLDILGEFVGISRKVPTLTNVFFQLDTASHGFGMGYLYVAETAEFVGAGITTLNDEYYRKVLKNKIKANNWHGDILSANEIMASVVPNATLVISDLGDMTSAVVIIGALPDLVTQQLLQLGYFDVKPAGVDQKTLYTPGVPGTPAFGLDANNHLISGFDQGSICQQITS